MLLSGIKMREMQGNGIVPPKEFSRHQVAEILIRCYQSLKNQKNRSYRSIIKPPALQAREVFQCNLPVLRRVEYNAF